MKTTFCFVLVLCISLSFVACGDDDTSTELMTPPTYSFTRDGSSTVSYSGQTTRIQMGEELADGLAETSISEMVLLDMFRNEKDDGTDADPFTSSDLNNNTKSIRSKVAASRDFYASNTTRSSEIRADFESWIRSQVTDTYQNADVLASVGQSGQIMDGSTVRYVNGKGLEYNQMVIKSLIGALMTDQMLNNYLSPAVLDEGMNVENNSNEVVEDGTNYTSMEHKWDEAYGYLFGNSPDGANPLNTLGQDDSYLNKYLGRVEGDEDYTGIAQEIYDAFKLGRAAIVAAEYDLRDDQAEIIKEKVSQIIAIRAIYYLQQAKLVLSATPIEYGSVFHDLSEGLGFIYSLQFTRKPNSENSYFTGEEVADMINQLYGSTTGFWSLNLEILDQVSTTIADAFDIEIEEAGN